jgi:outer membrane immunogenic protein
VNDVTYFQSCITLTEGKSTNFVRYVLWKLSNINQMKKTVIILLLSFITVLTVNSQSPLRKGGQQLNVGLGFSGWGVPLYVGLDFGIQRDFTLGIEGSFRTYRQNYKEVRYNSTIIGLSGNGNYHFNRILEIPSDWDFYAGLNIGYYFWSTPSDYPGPYSSGLGLGAQIGGRYFFRNNFGLNLEFGGGNAFSGGKFGITYIF